MIFAFDRVENIVGKGENAGHQHFLFSDNVFKGLLTQGRYKAGLCCKELKLFADKEKNVILTVSGRKPCQLFTP